MSYLEIENKDFYNDINRRKEFIENNIENNAGETKGNYYIDSIIKDNNKMILNNYQKFITNFINPNTKYNALLLIHSTGVGKTITSISTAINFINIYKEEKNKRSVENENSGMVYIIGFTKNIFKKELLSRPEFGIITKEELVNMNNLKKQIAKYNLEKDIATLKELNIRYSIRLKSKKGNGYFKFIGYKKLVNNLIRKIDLNYKLQISDIKTEEELQTYIDKKIIEVNYSFIEIFNKSLIICDEIHNVYNSSNINNWGMCLKLIFNHYKQSKAIRVLLLSATPINNKPIEILSLLELLNYDIQINKKDLFDKNNNITENGKSIIKKYIIGKISYLKDMNLELYPSKDIIGETIPGVDFLKFIKCPMSDLHFKTYKKLSEEYIANKNIITDVDINDTEEHVEYEDILNITDSLAHYKINLESNNRYLNDFVIPDPDNSTSIYSKSKYGIYTKIDITKKISNATRKWKTDNDIDIIKDDKLLYNTLTGNFLSHENIKKYSTKYYKMLTIIKNIILENKGKIFIYHNFVQVSGVNFIGEVLKSNGILEQNEVPVKFSRCGICYDFKHNHNDSKKNTHEFIPIRFILISSLLNKNTIEKKIELFNLNSNLNGEEIRIIIGSQAIKESYDLKAVQNLIMVHQPVNISTIIQIFGRAIRKNSHINLSSDKRNVNIYILVSSMPSYIQDKYKSYIYTFEEMKYKYKINIYKVIKKINNIFVENAIDFDINYNINFPLTEADEKKNNNDLYSIDYISRKKLIKIDYHKLNDNTFNTYYYQDEINRCKYIIKRLFIEYSNIWTYKDLFDNVKKPYFKTQYNTELISENSFILALDFLIYKKSNINIVSKNEEIKSALINNLFNNDEKYIYDIDNDINIIIYVNKYYMLIKLEDYNSSKNLYDNINIDYDILYRTHQKIENNEIDINEFIKNNNINDFATIKKYFIQKYSNVDITDMFNIISEYDNDFHLAMIEDIIEYLFNLYTNPEYSVHINHDLYLNLLYFYNKFNIIIFANKLDKELAEIYEKYIISTKNVTFTVSDDVDINYNYNMLISSLEDELNITPKIQFTYYKKAIAETDNYLKNRSDNKKIIKIFDYLLPVGHIFTKELRFYNPKKFWFNKLKYSNSNLKFVDNPNIIGYLEKVNIGFDIVFKIKTDNTTKKLSDKRQIQTGLNCLNIDKPELYEICKKLKIDKEKISQIKNRKNNICDLIKFELIRLELEERKKKSNIKYFYFYWE